jgi:hypothetical protein
MRRRHDSFAGWTPIAEPASGRGLVWHHITVRTRSASMVRCGRTASFPRPRVLAYGPDWRDDVCQECIWTEDRMEVIVRAEPHAVPVEAALPTGLRRRGTRLARVVH